MTFDAAPTEKGSGWQLIYEAHPDPLTQILLTGLAARRHGTWRIWLALAGSSTVDVDEYSEVGGSAMRRHMITERNATPMLNIRAATKQWHLIELHCLSVVTTRLSVATAAVPIKWCKFEYSPSGITLKV